MGMSMPTTLTYHGVSKPTGVPALAIVFAIAFHAALLMAFDRPWVRPQKVKPAKELPSDFVMVELKDETPPDMPKELEDTPAAPSAPVPTLAELPVVVLPTTDFTEEFIPTTPTTDALTRLDTIPQVIQHGPPAKEFTVFNPGDLDKKPQPISQTAPTFPYELQRMVAEGNVVVGFVVSSQGDVVQARIVSSSHPGFERSALTAIEKWKFRPGMKNGKKVNTRVEQPLTFLMTDDR